MANVGRLARSEGTIQGPGRAANTNDDLLTLDWSGYAEGYGFGTYGFAADPTGGWSGYYYLDGSTRYDFTSIERFNITGTDYADSIQTGDGIDTINAGGGNDLVYSGLGKDKLDGGAGIDGISRNLINSATAITINLRDDTVTAAYGTIKNFEFFKDFTGTTKNDTFISSELRGDDNINGGDGNDRAEFMRGYDTFTGGSGNDTLKADFSWSDVGVGISSSVNAESSGLGFNGYFYLDGPNRAQFNTTENFEVVGTKYGDSIRAASGNDIVMGGAGNDDIRTGAGNDTLDGGDGLDGVGRDFSLLATGVGIDLGAGTITGITGQIVNFEYFADVRGGSGNDVFVSTNALATDSVTGGGGDDTATFYNGHDYFYGTLGTDRLVIDYSAASAPPPSAGQGISTSLNVDSDGGYYGYMYYNGDLYMEFDSVEAFTVTGTMFADTIFTGNGDDTISGGDGYDVVRSGAGVDVLNGGAGIDGVGRDLSLATANITSNLLTNTFTGVGGSITDFEYFTQFFTGTGNDKLTTTRLTLNDSVNTGGGNDTFTTYAGYDTFTAGQGNDRLVIDWSLINYGGGINNISQTADASGGWQGYFIINNSPTRIDYTSVEAFTITGTNYADTMLSRGGDDVLNGLAGNDTLNAGAGADTIDGGDGFDGFAKDFTASNKNIVVDLTANTITNVDTTIANVEYLLDVRTGTGDDTFKTLGLKLNDVAWGGGGNDTAFFYSGYDTFNAGSGNKDKLVVDYSALDTEATMGSSVSVDSSNGGFTGYYYVEGDNRSDFSGVESVVVTGTKNNDNFGGTGGADTLNGDDGRDTISGADGNDTINGGLAGDALFGNNGDDKLTGGKGSDQLTGNAGADTFIFGNGDTGAGTVYIDWIKDFNRTTDADKIDLTGIDANTGVNGNQAFTFIDSAPFDAAGQVRLVTISGVLYLQGNVNADLAPDFAIRIDGETPVVTDFNL